MSDYSSDPTAECAPNAPNDGGVGLLISRAERADHSSDNDNIDTISRQIAREKNFGIGIGDESDHVSGQYMRNCNEMRGLLTSLLDAASDVQDEVRASISTAIFTLGRSKPYDVLLTVFNYLTSDRPKGYTQRICILQAVEEVCRDVGSDLNDHEVMEIAPLIVNEMVNSRQVIPQIQSPCSEALVGLGQSHCFQVMDILTSKFETSQLPHFFILQTMGSLATANVYTMVPFVKGILGPMLPMLNMVKLDNLKWAFAFVLARFCECVSEYLANIDKAPDPLVKKEFYSAEINTAFDVLFNSWLSSKDNKVRLQVAEAIGQMSHIMDTDKLSDWLPKLLPALLQLYKRHQEPYPVTCALALVLDASLMAGKHVLEMHMDAMLNALFQQVCATPDYTLPLTVKNHYEVLRCCDTLAKCSPEPVVGFYLSRLLHSSDRVRSSSLTVLKHLINASEFELAQKMQDIQAGLRLLLNDQSNKVKKALTQVIVALAHRGYLTQQDSALFVEFIVRQCCLPDDQTTKRVAEGDVSGESLRAMCESVLHLLSTTVEPMFPLLWPHLLEYLTADYAAALSTVLKCAGQLAERARQSQPEPDIYCGTDNSSLPRPAVLMAQLCVWLGCPECGARGQHALHLMRGLVNQINPALRPVWDAQLPMLQTRLTDEYDMESRCDWEQAVLDFISASLVATDNAEWMDQVGMAICRLLTSHQHQQHQLYHVEQPRERAFLMRCLAVCVCRQQDKQTVCSSLDTVFSATRHAHPAERKGCAQALGIMSSVHLDTILAKLDQVARAELTKKPTGLLGFMKDTKGEAAQERMRATVVLCYGQVAQMAPHHLLGDRLEVPIYRDLQTFLPNCRTSEVRLALVTSAGELAAALHPLRLKERVRFRGRDPLLEFTLSTLSVEHELSAVLVVLHAVTALLGLSPPVSGDQRIHTLRTVFDAVYPVKRELPQDHHSTLQYQFHGKVMSSLEGLVSRLLLSDFTAVVLDDLVSCLLPWTASQHVNERIHSMATLGYCLQIYLDQLGATDQDVSFSSGGQLLATLVPRCVDPELSIRPIAVDAVYTVLSVLCLCEGGRWNMDAVSELKELLLNCDDASINGHLIDLAQILSEMIGANQLGAFFDTLLLGVGDRHTSSALGAAVTLTVLLRCRGAEFYERVPDILHGLHGTLSEIIHQETRQEVLSAVQTLSSHHTAAVASALLLYPLPYDDHVVDCWRVLATDERLATTVLSQFIALISSMAPYEEQRDTSSDRVLRIASLQPLAAVSALAELFGVPEMARCCRAQEAALYVRLLSAQASYVSVFPPVAASSISGREQPAHAFVPNRSAYKLSPYRIASDALVAFLRCIDLAPLAQSVSECCGAETLEDVASYADFVMTLTSATVKQCPRLLTAMSPLVLVELSSMYETQRVAAVSFCVELVRHRGLASPPLVESLLGSLLSRLVDSSCVVRRLCLLGLGHMSALQTASVADADFSHLVEQFAPAAMSAMLAGLDDRADSDASIPLQAMRSLTAILPALPSEHVQHTLVPVTLRIRIYFESECTELRCGAFALFGVCAAFCQGPLRDQYLEQAHNNLVTLVVHLCDPQSAVVAACRGTLRAVAGLMSGTPRIADLLQRHLCDDERLQYANFLSQLALLMVEELLSDLGMYTMSLLAHLRSSWNELKGAAALFVAFLMCNLPADHRQNIRVQPVCCGLKKLLQDPDWHVRSQAAKAISLLHDY